MTGGAGFTSQGKSSYKANRSMLGNRPLGSTKRNSKPTHRDRSTLADQEEIVAYRKLLAKKEARQKFIIWGIVVGIVCAVALFIGLSNLNL